MTVTTCPRCEGEVSVPTGATASARVQCPLCQAEYLFEEVLAKLPPALILLDAPARQPVGSANGASADEADEQAFSFLGFGGADDPAEAGAAIHVGDSDEEGGSFAFEPGSSAVGTATAPAKTVPARKTRKSKNPVVELIKVIVAAPIGLLIGYSILLYGFKQDLGLKGYLPEAILPPALRDGHAEDSGAGASQPKPSSGRNGASDSASGNASDAPGSQTSPEPALDDRIFDPNAGTSTTDPPDDLFGDPAVPLEPPFDPDAPLVLPTDPFAPKTDPSGASPSKTPATKPPTEPGLKEPFAVPAAPDNDDPLGLPKVDDSAEQDPDGFFLDQPPKRQPPSRPPQPPAENVIKPTEDTTPPDVPMPPDAPQPPVEPATPNEPVGLKQTPVATQEQMESLTVQAQQARGALMPADAAERRAFSRPKYDAYQHLAEAAHARTSADRAAADEQTTELIRAVDQAAQELAQDQDASTVLGQFANVWLTFPERRSHSGIVLTGDLAGVERVGELVRLTVVLPAYGDKIPTRVVKIVTAPKDLKEQQRIVVVGTIVERPVEQILGYDGPDEQVIWGATVEMVQ